MADEWLSALQALDAQNPDGSTTNEIAESLGVSREKVMAYLGQLIRSGAALCSGQRRITNIAGRVSYVPVYRLVDKNTSRKQKR